MSRKETVETLRDFANKIEANPHIVEADYSIGFHCETSAEVIEVLKVTGIDMWVWRDIGGRGSRHWILQSEHKPGEGCVTIYVPRRDNHETPVRKFILDVREAQRIAGLTGMEKFAGVKA